MRQKNKDGHSGSLNRRVPRCSYGEYGIGRERLTELRDGCRAGKYDLEMLREACRGLETISPWILLSVMQGKSFDALSVEWELGRMEKLPHCRTDFYALRRLFFHNLDVILSES